MDACLGYGSIFLGVNESDRQTIETRGNKLSKDKRPKGGRTDLTQTERYEFQSEAREVLDLMIHSVYSNPDIFLRELVSNASDAIDKLRIEALAHDDLSSLAGNGRITISVDEEVRTITIA